METKFSAGMRRTRFTGKFLIFAAVLVLVSGCASWKTGSLSPAEQKARARVGALEQANQDPACFKGVGRYKVETDKLALGGRVIFAGQAPNRLRLEFLNPFGQPVLSLAADGKRISIYSRPDDLRHDSVQRAANLERYLGVPLSVEDLVLLFSGRVPLAGHRGVEPQDGGRVVLAGLWGGTRQELFLDPAGQVKNTNYFDGKKEPAYGIVFEDAGSGLPPAAALTTREGGEVRLVFYKYEEGGEDCGDLFSLPENDEKPEIP